jgi:predicted 2-oxoglutarate/Fe(II)-dependent dioxygenase YbiX
MSAPAAAVQSFLPGDMLPPLALPDAGGALYDLHQQSIAGGPRILILGGPDAGFAVPEALATAAEARGARLFLVSGSKPDGARRTDGPVRLFDPERRLFGAFGLPQGGVATITPRGRLGFVRAGAAALEAAIELLPEPSPDGPARRSGAPALLIPGVLEPGLCAKLIAHWEKGEKTRDRVASAAGAAAAAGMTAGIKRRTDVFLDDHGLYDTFRQRLERRVLPEMWRAYRFRAASFEAPRIGCYSAEDAGAFGAHRDNRTPFTAHRRFAMSLNLNTGEYEGGTLRFAEFGLETYEPEAGGCVIFCCDLLHEALPVTRGQRMAIFTFFTDAQGAEQERKLIAEAKARGQAGVAMR